MYALILVIYNSMTGSVASTSVPGFTDANVCNQVGNNTSQNLISASSAAGRLPLLVNYQCVKIKD